jgi:hypothetical protein
LLRESRYLTEEDVIFCEATEHRRDEDVSHQLGWQGAATLEECACGGGRFQGI